MTNITFIIIYTQKITTITNIVLFNLKPILITTIYKIYYYHFIKKLKQTAKASTGEKG